MPRYVGDPYWMTAKFPGSCSKCDKTFQKGERVFYYPKGPFAFPESCHGNENASDYFGAMADEEQYCNQY